MCNHEEKYCPRCRTAFECKVGDILQCQCYGVRLTPEEKALLEQRYEDCLCRNCLMELKQAPAFFKEKYFLHGGK